MSCQLQTRTTNTKIAAKLTTHNPGVDGACLSRDVLATHTQTGGYGVEMDTTITCGSTQQVGRRRKNNHHTTQNSSKYKLNSAPIAGASRHRQAVSQAGRNGVSPMRNFPRIFAGFLAIFCVTRPLSKVGNQFDNLRHDVEVKNGCA